MGTHEVWGLKKCERCPNGNAMKAAESSYMEHRPSEQKKILQRMTVRTDNTQMWEQKRETAKKNARMK